MTSPPTPFDIAHVGGIPFQVATLETASEWLLTSAIPRREGLSVRLANAYNVALASRTHRYMGLLTADGINFPDGFPVVWFMRLQREGKRTERVRGPSLFALTLEKSVGHNIRHFFLGSTPETLERLVRTVRSQFPSIEIAGSYSPPFAEVDDDYIADCAEKVSANEVDVVWVGLGTPKQDVLSSALARQTDLVFINVGAAFDFMAGVIKEAPEWVQRSGFEWAYRFTSEPRRLWRRYFFGNIQFLISATKHHLILIKSKLFAR